MYTTPVAIWTIICIKNHKNKETIAFLKIHKTKIQFMNLCAFTKYFVKLNSRHFPFSQFCGGVHKNL